jgi:hypothetical protein
MLLSTECWLPSSFLSFFFLIHFILTPFLLLFFHLLAFISTTNCLFLISLAFLFQSVPLRLSNYLLLSTPFPLPFDPPPLFLPPIRSFIPYSSSLFLPSFLLPSPFLPSTSLSCALRFLLPSLSTLSAFHRNYAGITH